MSLDHQGEDGGKIISQSNHPPTSIASHAFVSGTIANIRNGQHEHEKFRVHVQPQNKSPGNHKHQERRQSQEEIPADHGRIVNGDIAPVGKYPWFAAFVNIGCGGSLITSEFVLTAAHCVAGIYPSDNVRNIRIGAYCGFFGPSGCSDPEYTEELTFGYDGVFAHPEYQSSSFIDHDFALIKLNDQSSISPVQIDQGSLSPSYTPDKKLFAIGLGSVSFDGPLPNKLMHVDVSYISNEVCKSQYNEDYYFYDVVDETMMCAADPNEDACSGDSGGPLYDDENNVLVGVVSWGKECALTDFPGVYSRISEEWPWIQKTICENHSAMNLPDFCVGYSRTPSASPSNAPSYRPCDDDEIAVELDVLTDFYSYETSWNIMDTDTGEQVAGLESYDTAYTLYEHRYCIPSDSCMKFEMKDNYGDGILFPYGYNFTVDGVLLATSLDNAYGDFDYSEQVFFGDECVYTPSPTSTPSSIPTKFPTLSPTSSSLPTSSSAPTGDEIDAGLATIINNGIIMMGIQKEGQLNVDGEPDAHAGETQVGLRFFRDGGWYESIGFGCACEGFGVSGSKADGSSFSGGAKDTSVQYLSDASLTVSSGQNSATAKVVVDDTLRITHSFKPSSDTDNLYQVTVEMENLGSSTLKNLRYRRLVDWDIPDLIYNECVSVFFNSVPKSLEYITDDGFEGVDPLFDVSLSGINFNCPNGVGCPVFDNGPTDHGALFQFLFKNNDDTVKELPAGESFSFDIFYGAARNKVDADATLAAVGAEIATYGYPPVDGICSADVSGFPNVFMMGFKGIGGDPLFGTLTPTTSPKPSFTPSTTPSSLPSTTPSTPPTFAPCDNEMSVKVNVHTDNWSYETSWEITDLSTGEKLAGVECYDYSSFTLYEHQFCFPSTECLKFEMKDSYGDGIYFPYGYNVTVDDVLLATSLDDMFGDFNYSESVTFGNGCETESPSTSPSSSPSISPSITPSISPSTGPSKTPSSFPSTTPTMTPTDVIPCPEEDRDGKFWTGKLKERDNGTMKPVKKKCKWLANAGAWKINKYCSMTEGYKWTKPAREVCTEVCESC